MRTAKFFISVLIISTSTHLFAASEFQALLDRQSEEAHHARKEWDKIRENCREKYKRWTDSTHSDYDDNFYCQKQVNVLRDKLDDKHKEEQCRLSPGTCRR